MTNAMNEIQNLLKEIGPGRMSSTAYDTAWVARLGDIDRELSNRAMEWICENQLPDGSWGAKDVYYYHDRVICTLAAMIALTNRGRRAYDKAQIERGLLALEKITSGATQGLAADPNGATIGFEMIAPTLVSEAEKLGIIKQQGERILGRMSRLRNNKMAKLAGRKINRMVTPAFSSEMAGIDGQPILDPDNLQESNGSIANSPSATSYFAMHIKQGDQSALSYIRKWVSASGGAPNVAPFDIFEPAWALWNIRLLANLNTNAITLCQPHINYLFSHWNVDTGIGHASEYTPKDSDDSGLVFEVLSKFNCQINIKGVLNYEEADYFRCFDLEANPSISANIHVLGALREAGYEKDHSSVQKILKFLRSNRVENGSWFDKWHVSPYYATSHAIILAHGYDKEICQDAVSWIINSQHDDGSWGLFYNPTAEETAYAIQALCVWERAGNRIPNGSIERGAKWLTEHVQPPYEPLWIGKALYCPELVVQSTILSALQLAN